MSVIMTKTVEYGSRDKFTANVEIFESTMEVVNKCKDRKITDSSFNNMQTKSDYKNSWHGVGSYKEALDLMNDGWNEKVKELQNAMKNCKATQNDKRITFQNNVHGFAPIVPLAILGVPNSMINTTMKPIKSKIISIYYDMAINCGNSAEQVMDNGRKVVEAIVKLENCGYRVNLYSLQSYNGGGCGDIVAVKVKSANQPLDLKRICFPIIHSAMFRVIGFDWYSKFPKGKYRFGYGHSMKHEVGKEHAHEVMKKIFGDETVYLLADMVQESNVDYIVEQLKGGKVE